MQQNHCVDEGGSNGHDDAKIWNENDIYEFCADFGQVYIVNGSGRDIESHRDGKNYAEWKWNW